MNKTEQTLKAVLTELYKLRDTAQKCYLDAEKVKLVQGQVRWRAEVDAYNQSITVVNSAMVLNQVLKK